MNVIFLDIDGVMNSQLFYRARHRKRWLKLNTYTWWITAKIKFALNGFKPVYYSLMDYKTPESHTKFDYLFKRITTETDKEKWKWLSEFCNSTDTKICISSVWKHHFHGNPETNLEWWNDALLLLGFKQGTFVGITPSRETLRGTEIQNWINKNPVEKYAIIDDDSDMLPEQLCNFFLSDGYVGLTPYMIYRIDRHFKGLNKLVFTIQK